MCGVWTTHEVWMVCGHCGGSSLHYIEMDVHILLCIYICIHVRTYILCVHVYACT